MFRKRVNNRGFASIIELLLVLAIISFITYMMINLYFKKPAADKVIQKDLAEQGVNASNPFSAIDAAKSKADEANKYSRELEKQVEDISKDMH